MNLWFIARGAGLSALILLTVATAVGALVVRSPDIGTGTTTGAATRRYLVQYLHRCAAGLGLTVLALHLATIIADVYAHVAWSGALIPFSSGYRPTPVALGSLAAYTLLAVAVLGVARGRLAATPRGSRVWRRLHALAYVGWGLAMVHGFTAGSDADVGWVRLIFLGCLVVVAGAIAVRLTALRGDRAATPSGTTFTRPDVPEGATR